MSTRKVQEVTEVLCGTSFSKSTFSRLVGSLDADLKAWREPPLTVAYPYLIVDTRYEHVRISGQVVSQGVLVVKGVLTDALDHQHSLWASGEVYEPLQHSQTRNQSPPAHRPSTEPSGVITT